MNPEAIYKSYIQAGEAWADAHCTATQLEDQSKSILAQLTLEAKDIDGVNSMAEAKEIALSASGYRDHLRDAAEARRGANKAKVRWEAVQALFNAQRTVEATHRAANKVAA